MTTRISASRAVERMLDTVLEVIRYDYPHDAEAYPKGNGNRDFPGEPPHPDNRVPWDKRKWNHDRRFYSKRQAHDLCESMKIRTAMDTTPSNFAARCLVTFANRINEVAPFDLRVGNLSMKLGKRAAQLEFTIESQRKCRYTVENTFTYGDDPLKAIKLACAYALLEGAKSLPCVKVTACDILREVRAAVKDKVRTEAR